MSIGLPELLVILFTSAVLLMPIVLAVWMITALSRLRATQKSLQGQLDTMRQSLQVNPEQPQATPQDAGPPASNSASGGVCAWCGKPLTEEEAFWLRAGARLCPSCTADAGRIAAEQRLGKGPLPPSADH